ncbi:hypothetical protein ACODT3_31115 [Streptomyces sp. 4.24]|uniref:hypothetical protein n=1 Tax=Streptomyces tritrimontium TaxID=3406573 RepID=UPI003BB4F4AA
MAHVEAAGVRAAGVRTAGAVHSWQTKIAAAACALPPVPGLLMLAHGLPAPAFFAAVLVTAAPLAFRGHRAAFGAACVIAGCLLLPTAFFGFYVGLFIFLFPALVLPLAVFADPTRHRIGAPVATGVACLLITVSALIHGCVVVVLAR